MWETPKETEELPEKVVLYEKHRVKREVSRDTHRNGRTYGYVGETPTKTASSPTKMGEPEFAENKYTYVIHKKNRNNAAKDCTQIATSTRRCTYLTGFFLRKTVKRFLQAMTI